VVAVGKGEAETIIAGALADTGGDVGFPRAGVKGRMTG